MDWVGRRGLRGCWGVGEGGWGGGGRGGERWEMGEGKAGKFGLAHELLARHHAGAASAEDADKPLLRIECMDGRALRQWHFSLAAVLAARFVAADDSWSIARADSRHSIKCFAAISGDNAELPDDASNDD